LLHGQERTECLALHSIEPAFTGLYLLARRSSRISGSPLLFPAS